MTAAEPRYFFIIGAMKAGTTSLYKYLVDHPEIYASPRKEPRVFKERRPEADLRADFLELFVGRAAQPWCFEASTAYAKHPNVRGVPERIRAVVPDPRFVYLVRNPVERAWSHYLHNVAEGREIRPFREVVEAQPQYLDIGRYHMQAQQYLDVFPRESLLIEVFEEMIRAPADTVRRVTTFLGVDSNWLPPRSAIAFNASSTKVTASRPLRAVRRLGLESVVPWRVQKWMKDAGTPLPSKQEGLSAEVRTQLVDALRPDVEALFHLLGRRIPSWADFV